MGSHSERKATGLTTLTKNRRGVVAMPTVYTNPKRWRQMSIAARRKARSRQDWAHMQSQLTWGDIDEVHDELQAHHGLKLSNAQMLSLVLESAHVTSGKIMAIHRSIWFNLHRGA